MVVHYLFPNLLFVAMLPSGAKSSLVATNLSGNKSENGPWKEVRLLSNSP